MQKHAVLMGLGSLGPDGLALAVQQALAPALGGDWHLDYSQAMPAGGGVMSAADYARFLRGLLDGRLQLGTLLGRHAVCTNPQSCPNEAVKTPIPGNESWHYSLGHWVEDDPQVGDGAFSSPGAFGFYPWISADRRLYGLVAREQRSGVLSGDPGDKPAVASVACGREIRAAWTDGQPRR
jgi:CubicO group peptidase (beta-lactamase class C family)